ncbi:MAG: hypothetical protein AAB824_00160, partial [Patescibacteria group bacterium]
MNDNNLDLPAGRQEINNSSNKDLPSSQINQWQNKTSLGEENKKSAKNILLKLFLAGAVVCVA